jgi:acyl dehydratase
MTERQPAAVRTTPLSRVTSSWLRAYDHFSTSVVEANRAAFAAMGFPDADGRTEIPMPSIAFRDRGWSVERTVESPEHISVGDHVRFSKVLSDEDVRAFAQISGDTNRLHLDDEFAEDTRFGRRIVHGTLASGLISAALARLPGLTIYLSQDLRFLAPVDVGDRVTAVVEIVEDLGDERYRLTTAVLAGDDDDPDQVIDGEAVVLIDDLPDE